MRRRGPWNHNIHYYNLVVRSVPLGCERALDVGCGTGLLARRLAHRSELVIGMDLDHDLLSPATFPDGEPKSRVRFVEADVMRAPFAPASFDFVTAVAMLHHVPLRPALATLGKLLKPGGVLAIVGLYRHQTLSDFALDTLAVPSSWLLRALRGYFEPPTRKQMPTETLREIRDAGQALLPGSVVRRLLLFRYQLTWKKPV
jgi:SAM-dependent methyltransferase